MAGPTEDKREVFNKGVLVSSPAAEDASLRESSLPSRESEFTRKELEHFSEAYRTLDDLHQVVLHLVDIKKMSYKEVADTLNRGLREHNGIDFNPVSRDLIAGLVAEARHNLREKLSKPRVQ